MHVLPFQENLDTRHFDDAQLRGIVVVWLPGIIYKKNNGQCNRQKQHSDYLTILNLFVYGTKLLLRWKSLLFRELRIFNG